MQVTEYGYTVKAQCVSGRGYVDASEMQVRGAWSSWNLYAKMMITSDGLICR